MRAMLIRRVIALAALDPARMHTLAAFHLAATPNVEGVTQLSAVRGLGDEVEPCLANLNLAIGFAPLGPLPSLPPLSLLSPLPLRGHFEGGVGSTAPERFESRWASLIAHLRSSNSHCNKTFQGTDKH